LIDDLSVCCPRMLHTKHETERLLLGGDESPVQRQHYSTNSLVVYLLNENILFGLLFFPKGFTQLGYQAKFIEWWWRLGATIFAFCVSILFLTLPIIFEIKEPNFLLIELQVAIASFIAYELFRVFRDHYLLLTLEIRFWLNVLKLIFFDLGLPMLILGSFVFSIKIFPSWNTSSSGNELVTNSSHAQWLSAWTMTFFLQTLWCMVYFSWRSCCFEQVDEHLHKKVKLSVSYLITQRDSPVFKEHDGTDRESTCRKIKRILFSLGYLVIGFGLVVTIIFCIYHGPKAQTSK